MVLEILEVTGELDKYAFVEVVEIQKQMNCFQEKIGGETSTVSIGNIFGEVSVPEIAQK